MNKKQEKERRDRKDNGLPPKLYVFVVEVEGTIPSTTKFRVMAEDEEQAFEIFDKTPHMAHPLGPPMPHPGGRIKKTKISIRSATSAFITWVRKF